MQLALEQIVKLSNAIGADERLVQPGGGNTSIKIQPTDNGEGQDPLLFVKGSGTDLRSIRPAGFTRLALRKLSALRDVDEMNDTDMMEFMATCMVNSRDPFPSVETPLHSILPYTVIVHTHDIATMSLTNLNDSAAERLVQDLFEDRIMYMPYSTRLPTRPLGQRDRRRHTAASGRYDTRPPRPGRVGPRRGHVPEEPQRDHRNNRRPHFIEERKTEGTLPQTTSTIETQAARVRGTVATSHTRRYGIGRQSGFAPG